MMAPETRLPAKLQIATPVMNSATILPRRAAGYHCVR